MRYIEVESRLRRVLAVVKVRASRHSDEVREFTIDGEGIHIGAPMREYEGLLAGSPSRYRAPGPTAGTVGPDENAQLAKYGPANPP